MAVRLCTGKCGRNRAVKFFTPRGTVCVFCRKETRARTTKAARLEETYDITIVEYDLIMEAQGGVCAVCGQPRRYPLHVDHDHAVEKLLGSRASVRGCLCKQDNKLLRDVRDSIPRLRALIAYLENPPAKRVLNA